MEEIIKNYGIWAFLSVYLIKTLYEILAGQTARNIRALDENTAALKKVSKDLRVAFHNIRKIREKNNMGEVEMPPEFDQ